MSVETAGASAGTAGAVSGETVKQMIYKSYVSGTSKKGNPYQMVTLHDPVTLDNIDFFLDGTFSVAGLQFKDKVTATFGMEFRFQRLQPVLVGLKKAI